MELFVAWVNRRHFATPALVSSRNDVWETSAEFHADYVSLPRSGWCFWLVAENFQPSTTQIWCRVISMEIMRSYVILRCPLFFQAKLPVVYLLDLDLY